jgi:tetratricopeptide (TPR) repeat protein
LLRQALDGRKHKLGADHPDCFESMHELAVLYREQERYEEAEKYFLEALEGRRLKLGEKHPHTIESLNNLIDLYEAWNKPEKAKQWRVKLPKGQ